MYAAVSHCCLTEKGQTRLADSQIDEMVTTDSISLAEPSTNSKVRVLSVAPLLGEAIRRIHEDRSVSSLFRLETSR